MSNLNNTLLTLKITIIVNVNWKSKLRRKYTDINWFHQLGVKLLMCMMTLFLLFQCQEFQARGVIVLAHMFAEFKKTGWVSFCLPLWSLPKKLKLFLSRAVVIFPNNYWKRIEISFQKLIVENCFVDFERVETSS